MIALATAQQESRLRNLDYGDRDSLGLFQQRPSQGWGTEAQVQDPVYAAGKFYDGLVKVPDWETGRLTEIAQAVQRSAASRRRTSSGRTMARGAGRGAALRAARPDRLRPRRGPHPVDGVSPDRGTRGRRTSTNPHRRPTAGA